MTTEKAAPARGDPLARVTIHVLYDCGICGALHPWDFAGDCREDNHRYDGVEDYTERHGVTEAAPDGHMQIFVRSMEDRVLADRRADEAELQRRKGRPA